MTRKRILTAPFILALLLVLALSLFSCELPDLGLTPPENPPCTSHVDRDGNGTCDTEGCGEAVTPAPCSHADGDGDGVCDGCGEEYEAPLPEGTIRLIENGSPRFQFVVQSGLYSDAVPKTDALIALINERLSDPALKLVDDRQDNIAECEVIIGTAKYRDEKYCIDGHDWGPGGYAIKIIDKKIIIVGGSDEGLITAISIFSQRLLDAMGTGPIDDFCIDESICTEYRITDYPISSITIASRPISELVIAADKSILMLDSAATYLRDRLYLDVGVWLDIVYPETVSDATPAIRLKPLDNTGEGNGLRIFVDGHGSLVFECEFILSFEDAIKEYVDTRIFGTGSDRVAISSSESFTKNLRDIYYSDFGAVGDGITDDFAAVKEAHDRANADGHVVHADAGATYYFGKGSGADTIKIMTDTYWHGCTFIFDDSEIAPKTPEYAAPVFTVAGGYDTTSYKDNRLPITSIRENATNIGFAPGFRALVTIHNSNVAHYIRFGPNRDDGNPQQEFVMVDPDGTIDKTTPLQWDYDTITSITVKRVDDLPITVDGMGESGERTTVRTIANTAPSAYTYYQRNIKITRSNATVKGVCHIITGEGASCAPYAGFTEITRCEKSTVEGFVFQRPKTYYTVGTGASSVGMGTYEISASYANEPTWKDCTQSNFFETNGGILYHGMMGTNYCRNLVFDGMFSCSFDAHKAAYNATIRNSTVEHLNFIGEGTITLENVTVYAEASGAAIILRDDYGSTWEGKLIIDGLDMRYYSAWKTDFGIIKAKWNDHDFGYTCYLPEEVYLKNVTLSLFNYSMAGGVRTETTVAVNATPLSLVTSHVGDISKDISRLTADGGAARYNPYVGTKKVVVEQCGTLTFSVPNTPLFADTELWINGVKQQRAASAS